MVSLIAMKPIIRIAQKEDMPSVLRLINELAVHEKNSDAVDLTVEDLVKDGFTEPVKFTCFVAETQNDIVGIAVVYMRYSTWKGLSLHLEDLVVSETHRGKGLGSDLLDTVVKHGNAKGVKRISWEVHDWNENAIKFYDQKGANILRDWHLVQLDEEGIKEYLSNI